jgi:single-stranded DNA-binding protein
MAADNHTTIVGNLVEDPELRFTDTGIAPAQIASLQAGQPSDRGQSDALCPPR